MEIEQISITQKNNRNLIPRFIDPNKLTEEQKHPDYRLKMLQDQYSGMNSISCSKCHHCR